MPAPGKRSYVALISTPSARENLDYSFHSSSARYDATVTLLRPHRLFAILLFIGLFAMAARNVLDPDIWWHLKTGEWIVQHRAVPHTDPFSYTRAGQPWIAQEWLFELSIYGLFRLTGYGGLTLTFATIVSAAFLLMYLRCQSTSAIAAALTVWGALATAVVWGVRPQILSLLLFSLWLWILERSEKNPKLLWWTLPLTLLWVNVHAGFILGPVFLALFIAGESMERYSSSGFVQRRLPWLLLALLGNLALVPLNPNGFSILWYPFQTLRSNAMQSYISEWASPNFHGVDYRAFLFLILATFAALAFSRRKVRLRDILLLLVSTAAALSSVRMIPLFVLVAVPLLARTAASDRFKQSRPSATNATSPSVLANAGIVFLLAAFAGVHTFQVIQRQPRAEATAFPVAAVAYLQQHPPSGPVFNEYSWGGYLIFRLYPNMRVFIDGRADLYGDDLLQFINAYYLQKNWQQVLLAQKVTTVIVPPDCPLASALREMPEWSLSYQDSVAAIFSRPLYSSSLPGKVSSDASRQGGATGTSLTLAAPY